VLLCDAFWTQVLPKQQPPAHVDELQVVAVWQLPLTHV
jgi:hypothetical protein